MTAAEKKKIRRRRGLYENAVAALLSHKDIKSAAASIGISYTTLYRWQREEEFIKLYSEAKRDILEGVKNSLRQLGAKAVTTLDSTIDNRMANDSDKLNASKYVIDRILDFEITDDLAARIAAIEETNVEKPD